MGASAWRVASLLAVVLALTPSAGGVVDIGSVDFAPPPPRARADNPADMEEDRINGARRGETGRNETGAVKPPLPAPSNSHISRFWFRARLAEACNPNVTLVAYSSQDALRFYLHFHTPGAPPRLVFQQGGIAANVTFLHYDVVIRKLSIEIENTRTNRDAAIALQFRDFTRDVERMVERLACFAAVAEVKSALPPPPLYNRVSIISAVANVVNKAPDGITNEPSIDTPVVPNDNVRVENVHWDLPESEGNTTWMNYGLDATITAMFIHSNKTVLKQWMGALKRKQMLLCASGSVKMVDHSLHTDMDATSAWDAGGANEMEMDNMRMGSAGAPVPRSGHRDPHWSVYLIAGLVVVAVSACLGTFTFCVFRKKLERERAGLRAARLEHRAAIDAIGGGGDDVEKGGETTENGCDVGTPRLLTEFGGAAGGTPAQRGYGRGALLNEDGMSGGHRTRLARAPLSRGSNASVVSKHSNMPSLPDARGGRRASASADAPVLTPSHPTGHAHGPSDFSDNRSLDRYDTEDDVASQCRAAATRYGRPRVAPAPRQLHLRSGSFPEYAHPVMPREIDYVPGPGWESTMDGTDLSVVSDIWAQSQTQASLGAPSHASPTNPDSRGAPPRFPVNPSSIASAASPPFAAAVAARRETAPRVSGGSAHSPSSPQRHPSGSAGGVGHHVVNFDSASQEPPTEGFEDYSQ